MTAVLHEVLGWQEILTEGFSLEKNKRETHFPYIQFNFCLNTALLSLPSDSG